MDKKIVIAIVVIVVATGALIAFVKLRGEKDPSTITEQDGTRLTAGSFADSQKRIEQAQASIEALAQGKVNEFFHPQYGFTFQFPVDFRVGNFPAPDSSEVVLVQKDQVGFQLYIKPFDEDIILTAERIKQDLPGQTIDEPLHIRIGDADSSAQGGSGQATALVFFSDSESLGRTREIWWVYRGSLYQITTYAEFDEAMVAILETWRFE